MMSGGPIRKFTEGWATAIFHGRRAHYFVRFQMSGRAAAMCGAFSAPIRALRGDGTFTHCRNCERWLKQRELRK